MDLLRKTEQLIPDPFDSEFGREYETEGADGREDDSEGLYISPAYREALQDI